MRSVVSEKNIQMTAIALSPAKANLKLALWQAEADSMSSSDLFVWLTDSGLPQEVILRLHELVTFTKKVGQKVFAIGKIVLMKILEFIKAHPHLVLGAGMGAVLGLAVSSLMTSVPLIGQLLAPLAAVLGLTSIVFGAVAGHRIDKRNQGKEVAEGIMGFAEDSIEVAMEFFKLAIDVFKTVFQNVIIA